MNDAKRSSVRIKAIGLVHGVFFRATMAQVASESGVRGWVRNMTDGSVEAHLEGEQKDVDKVIAWARRGPPRARVDYLEVKNTTPRNFHGFKIDG